MHNKITQCIYYGLSNRCLKRKHRLFYHLLLTMPLSPSPTTILPPPSLIHLYFTRHHTSYHIFYARSVLLFVSLVPSYRTPALIVKCSCDVLQWSSLVVCSCDELLWRAFETCSSDVFIWRAPVTCSCDVFMWQTPVTCSSDVLLWRDTETCFCEVLLWRAILWRIHYVSCTCTVNKSSMCVKMCNWDQSLGKPPLQNIFDSNWNVQTSLSLSTIFLYLKYYWSDSDEICKAYLKCSVVEEAQSKIEATLKSYL